MLDKSSNASRRTLLTTAGSALSLAVACFGTFLVQPFVQQATAEPIRVFAEAHYFAWVAWMMGPLWWWLTASATLFGLVFICKIVLDGSAVSMFSRFVRR
ncbi:hypothetical protein [Oceanicaulis alexandrii]|uniref:hypothetical protein n=1 Tax=Oceanicaulis alexandrii TaxID=153233 RepID=UPI003B5037B3